MATFIMTKRVFARERLTATSGAVKQLTASSYNQSASPVGGNQNGAYKRRATGALIQLCDSTGSQHYTVNGTDPTTGSAVTDVGFTAAALDCIVLESYEAIENFKAIALVADSIFEVWYLR